MNIMMAGSTQSYVSSKRHEKWRQRKPPPYWRQTLISNSILLLYIWSCLYLVLTLISSYPILYCNTSFSSGVPVVYPRSLSVFFIFWRALHYVTLVPSFPGVKKLHLSRYSKLPLSSLTWNKNHFRD